MTLMEFIGCACTAYSPALALCTFTVLHDPIRIIILVASAFFWLVSLLVSSIFWRFILFKHLFPLSIVVTVIFQEIFRYFIYIALKRAEQRLTKLNVPNTNKEVSNNKHVVPFVSGLGFGVMSGCFSYLNILAELAGPGTTGLLGEPQFFCLFSAIYTMIFTLLHTFWSVIFFSAVSEKSYVLFAYVIISHVIVSTMTLLNTSTIYLVPMITAIFILFVTAYITYRICKGTVSAMPVREHVQS